MVELNLEHVLILVIVAFVLYHLSRCNCFNSNSFSVGGHPDCIATADSVLNNAQCNALGINEAKCRDDTNNFCKWVEGQKQKQLFKIDPSLIEDSPYPTDSCEGRYATIYVGTYRHFFHEDKDVEANAKKANVDVPPSDNFDNLGNFKDITKVETYINQRYNDELKYLRDNCDRESLGNSLWCIASSNSSIICDIIWEEESPPSPSPPSPSPSPSPSPEDACTDVYCANGGRCVNGQCVCAQGYSGPECMDDCATARRGLLGQFRTGNKEIPATGCNPLRDMCMLDWCPQTDVPVCRIGGPEFKCIVSGVERDDCKCVQPLFPCKMQDPEIHPGGVVSNCNGHGTPIDGGMHGCHCDEGWEGPCCTEQCAHGTTCGSCPDDQVWDSGNTTGNFTTSGIAACVAPLDCIAGYSGTNCTEEVGGHKKK